MNVIEHTLEVEIAAPVSRVWKALTEQVSLWWHPGFFSREGAVAFVIEPKVGGRAYEDWGNGQGLLWYTVAGVAKNELLQLVGDMDAKNGGPARMHSVFRLRAEGKGSVLRLEECAFDAYTDIERNGKLDVAFREIYYNNGFFWSLDGPAWNDGEIDVETIVLHETGHGLSQGNFGKVFFDASQQYTLQHLHFSPRAVMNAVYWDTQRELLGTDVGGHCSIWARWPLK